MKLNRANFAEFFRTDYYTINVIFEADESTVQRARNPSTRYTYKVPQDIKLQIGDRVVVMPQPGVLKSPIVVEVHENPQIEEDTGFNFKWIVGKYDDMVAGYKENVERDQRLKKAVAKLEQKLEQISLRKQLALAMEELGEADKQELTALFGTELLPKPLARPVFPAAPEPLE